MKIIIFGGSGFLGSHVADVLTQRGFDVIIYDKTASPYLIKAQQMIVGDILDSKAVGNAVKGCDYVYNFAGVADIAEAFKNPVRTVEVNILGNARIVQACVDHKVKRFIFASSLYVYSDLASFYRSSKQSCESIIEEYQKLYHLDFTILRYGSLYGPRAGEDNFFYKIIKQCIEEKKILRKGDGEEMRDYINALDAARCSADVLTEEFKNQYVIIAGTQSIKVKDLLNMVKEMFKDEIAIQYVPDDTMHHYTITPYSFKPKVAKKLVSNYYHDLGQGILDMVYDVYERHPSHAEELVKLKRMIGS